MIETTEILDTAESEDQDLVVNNQKAVSNNQADLEMMIEMTEDASEVNGEMQLKVQLDPPDKTNPMMKGSDSLILL